MHAGQCGKKNQRASRCGKQKDRVGSALKTVTVSKIVGWLAHFNRAGADDCESQSVSTPAGMVERFSTPAGTVRKFSTPVGWFSTFPHRLACHTLLPCLTSEKLQKL
jgi:hypothetical protein